MAVGSGRPVLATWAEAGRVLTGDLPAGDQSPHPTRPPASNWIRQAVAGLPKGTKRTRVRCDSGLFPGEVAWAAVDAEADVSIAAARRAIQLIPNGAWRLATGMVGAVVILRANEAYRAVIGAAEAEADAAGIPAGA